MFSSGMISNVYEPELTYGKVDNVDSFCCIFGSLLLYKDTSLIVLDCFVCGELSVHTKCIVSIIHLTFSETNVYHFC